MVWNRRTGRPYGNAIVWQDTRTDGIAAALERDGRGDLIRYKAGLPPATYFSGGKLRWMLDHIDGLRADAERGAAIFGTVDTWLLWNLTGGVHLTDVTNASRTMLMNLTTLDWDDELLELFTVPRAMLPRIAPSAEPSRSAAPSRRARSAASCPSPACWAISRPPWSGRCASPPARPRTPTGPATSCC